MKIPASVLLAFSLVTICAWAEDVPGGKASLQVQSGKKGAEQMAAPGVGVKAPAKPGEPRFFYGGFLSDLVRGNKSAKPIDLRFPPKPRPESDNVYTDPQTGAAKGFVLFAIKF